MSIDTHITAHLHTSPRSLRAVSVLLLLAIFLLISPTAPAWASWPLEGDQGVLVGYQETYGSSITHHGVDLSAEEGQKVCAPVSGTVSFMGDVPASETSEGETMRAVSITLSDGRILTMMPFQDTWVSQGSQVEEGEAVGTLAASGDRSSSSSHLHVGLKKQGRYLNPSSLLGLSVAGEELVEAESADVGLSSLSGDEDPVEPGIPMGALEDSAADTGDAPILGEVQDEESTVDGSTVASKVVSGGELIEPASMDGRTSDLKNVRTSSPISAVIPSSAATSDASALYAELERMPIELYALIPVGALVCLGGGIFIRSRKKATVGRPTNNIDMSRTTLGKGESVHRSIRGYVRGITCVVMEKERS